MKRIIAGMAAILLAAISFFPLKAEAVSAKCAILMDAYTGRVLYEKDSDQQALIASTTKIMTALVVCEQCNVLDRMRIPKEAVGIEGSSMYLKEGEILTIQELLYGLMLHSGNDAAVALAIYCGGTVEGFVQLMNDKARELGMVNSYFENPNGLDAPGHYSTARDMAILTAYAMKNPLFQKTVSTKTVSAGERTLRNHNKLLWQFEGADGVKTGYTRAAGRILVSSAVRAGRRLIAVTIDDPNDWKDHISMLEDGFENYSNYTIVEKGTCLGSVDVISGSDEAVSVYATESCQYALAKDETVDVITRVVPFVYAPVFEGKTAGFAYICVDGTVVGKVPTHFGKTVEVNKNNNVSWFKRGGVFQ